MFRRAFGLALAVAGLALAAYVPAALADNGDVTCNGVAPTSVQHDLIVNPGAPCIVLFASTIGHDVIVNPGGSLDDRGAYIAHDIQANQPLGIHINGGGTSGPGTVGHDIVINGVTGTPFPPTLNSVCNNIVGHDVVIENSAATAAGWSIGDRNGVCGGGAVSVGHDMQILNNANRVEVEDNSPAVFGEVAANIGHDLVMSGNTGGLVAEANNAGHDCTQSSNSPYSNHDGDNDGPNTAGHSVDSCNTPNP